MTNETQARLEVLTEDYSLHILNGHEFPGLDEYVEAFSKVSREIGFYETTQLTLDIHGRVKEEWDRGE